MDGSILYTKEYYNGCIPFVSLVLYLTELKPPNSLLYGVAVPSDRIDMVHAFLELIGGFQLVG